MQTEDHLFRHTMATLMLEGGADVRYVQEMLGHSKLETTQIYTHVSIKRLQAVHAATHPAAKLRPTQCLRAEDDASVDLPPDPSPSARDLLLSLAAEAAEEDDDVDA